MLLVLAAAAALPAHVSAMRPTSAARCERATTSFAANPDPKATIRRLDEMPPATMILGVLYDEAGCLRPIVVREQVGQSLRPTLSRPR